MIAETNTFYMFVYAHWLIKIGEAGIVGQKCYILEINERKGHKMDKRAWWYMFLK